MPKRSVAQFVMKVSKYCNLRCTYCYEYNQLGNKERMSLPLIANIFTNIARHAIPHAFDCVSFVWHGGEPFLIPLDYYDSIGKLQRELFGNSIEVWNVAQTNLTVMTDRHLQYLKAETFFRGVGVSFDVVGDQRRDVTGGLPTDRILLNMQQLLNNGIPFGAITVLARNTLPYVKQIYHFYDELRIEHRFLPFYMYASDNQINCHAITYSELVSAYKLIFNQWISSENATAVDPISEYVDYAVAYLAGRRSVHYHRESDEYVFIVDLDGGVWGQGEAYDPRYRYGNLAHDDLGALLASEGRHLSILKAEARTKRHCDPCAYYGACPGHFVADCSPQQQEMIDASGCPVREVVSHIVRILEETGLNERIKDLAGGARNDQCVPLTLL